jgi:Protein of unknown function (DUF2809)
LIAACDSAPHRPEDCTIDNRTAYAVAAILFFLTEVAIAALVHDAIVRPYLGDSLAVVLVYCAVRAATPLGMRWSAAAALALACAIEIGQWFHLADLIGLGHIRIARIVLGTGFDPTDFLAYAGGAVAVLIVEAARQRLGRAVGGNWTGEQPGR